MGVYHFMGLGQAVGAVTCAVDYIEKALDTLNNQQATEETKRLFAGSGGINHPEQNIGKIEAIVLFTSHEVIDGKLTAFKYKDCLQPGSVRNEVMKQLGQVWRRRPKIGAKIFWCEVDINDYQDCFNKAIKVAYRFSPPGKQGKEIWCNMTGGTNSIQLALLSMARLTGVSTTHYIISQKPGYREEVRVPHVVTTIAPGKDNYFNILPFIKLSLDTLEFYNILTELTEPSLEKQSISNEDLLSRLKNKNHFIDCSLENFTDRYLLKLYGLGYTEYKNHKVGITEDGYYFLVDNLSQLKEQLINPARNIVEDSKNWRWFTEQTL